MAMFFQTKKRKEIVVTKLLRLSELCPVLSFPVSLRDFFFFFWLLPSLYISAAAALRQH